MLKRLVCTLLFGVLFAACRTDDESSKIFVTDIEIAEDAIFAPGDPVTVRATGFEPQDRIMFDIRYPLEDELFPEGYAKGIWAVEWERTETEITFLAPGGYPASTVGILLFREGRMQMLGTIRVSDGQAPDRYALYGVHISGDDTYVDRIDSESGAGVYVKCLDGIDAHCPVNDYGSNRIYGLAARGEGCVGFFYDLTMGYWADSDPQQYVAVGTIASSVGYMASRDGQLWLEHLNATRTSPVQPVRWTLPEGVTPEMLATTPFAATSDGCLLLAADRGDGSFVPVVLCAGSGQVRVGEPIEAGALIPFVTVRSREEGVSKNYLAGGYAISKPGGGASELRLFDVASMAFEEPFATSDDAVWSVAVDLDSEGQEIYLLTEDMQGIRRIRAYDRKQHVWRALPGEGLPYRAIVLAR